MGYEVKLITAEEKTKLFDLNARRYLYTKKANIYGCCIKLLTELEDVKDRWEDNFYTADENIRSHGRVVVLKEEGIPLEVKYDPYTNTAFLTNVDYYGWIKSITLAVAGDVLEDEHGIYPVHGAAIDVDGTGVSIIAPPGTGKTTHSWGLLRLKGARLVTDDWYFVRMYEQGPMAFGSEKNCYVEADIGKIWMEYEGLLEKSHFDRRGRAIVNVRWAVGSGGVVPMTTLRKIIMLKREKEDPTVVRKLGADEALDYLIANDFCNPHQLVRDERKLRLRRDFFKKLFEVTEVYLVNTIKPAHETHKQILNVIRS
ncbi:MAG TPA: hypothetical protein EYP46_04395 [Hadesarchaea archaeon]|nr:hypothetical protein [Hadesarchaea archaeon]